VETFLNARTGRAAAAPGGASARSQPRPGSPVPGPDVLQDSPGTDTLNGQDDNDTLNTKDNTAGDTDNGGPGTDSCTVDATDTTTSCES